MHLHTLLSVRKYCVKSAPCGISNTGGVSFYSLDPSNLQNLDLDTLGVFIRSIVVVPSSRKSLKTLVLMKIYRSLQLHLTDQPGASDAILEKFTSMSRDATRCIF